LSDDDLDLLESMGLRVETTTPDMTKGWMQFHNFVLVSDISQVEAIVEDALARGECSLDLETEGLDSRIYYRDPSEIKGPYEEYWEGDRPSKIMQTVHKVVGYCMSTDGHTGYYIPVRHTAEGSINLDPVAVGKLIKKLCMASQPTLTEEGFHKDPLGSSLIAEPGTVKIYFWNAKFDQEFLYPITGLDYWHPDSYEDGLLLYFARNTSDKNLSLKAKSKSDLHVKDAEGKPILGIVRPNPNNPIQETVELSPKGDRIPYEMIELKQLFGKGRDIKFAELHPQEGLRYGCSDGICTFLHAKEPGIVSMIKDKRYSFMYRLDKQTQQVCRIMERPRIMIDMDKVRELFTEARAEANLYREQIVSLAEQHGFHNFDPQSPQQVSEFFFSKPHGLCIEPKPEQNEKSGQYKTDADTLEKLVTENDEVNPILLTLVKYRQIEKVIGTYLENMIANVDSNNELRYQFKQVGAATTRFSAPAGQGDQGFGGVPIHGIPSGYDEKKPKVATRLRELFKARPGYAIVKIDFAGEELRIATNMSKEPVWINEFLHGTGDLHTITAQAFFNKVEVTKQERQGGKMANFSLIFGGGVGAIQRATKCNPQEAARRKANFDKALPKFAIWSKGQKAKVHKEKGIFSAFGRWMALPDIDSPEKFIVASVERQAVNYGIQASGADIMRMALVMTHKECFKRGWYQRDEVRCLLTVHDEIVWEVKIELLEEVVPVLEHLMCEPSRIIKWEVPLEAEPLVDLTWDAKYDFNLMTKGKPHKEGDKIKSGFFVAGSRQYQEPPEWFKPYFTPNWVKEGLTPGEVAKPEPKVEKKPEPLQAKPVQQHKPSVAPRPTSEIFEYQILTTTANTVRQVWKACSGALEPSGGKILHLRDGKNAETLISPDLGVRVNPEEFMKILAEHNL